MEPKTADQIAPVAPGGWDVRITGSRMEDPEQLLANPRNWRIHPLRQQKALGDALDKIGWIQPVIVNEVTGHVVDGHLRVAMAISRGEQVPVNYVELSPEEEAIALATIDPLAALAVTDDSALRGLMSDIESSLGPALEEMIADVAKSVGSVAPKHPSQQDIDDAQAELKAGLGGKRDLLEVTCPGCGENFAVDRDDAW